MKFTSKAWSVVERILLYTVATLALVVGVALLSLHLWTDHKTLHFNAQLIEAVRQVVLEKHPELVAPAPPVLSPPPPLEESR